MQSFFQFVAGLHEQQELRAPQESPESRLMQAKKQDKYAYLDDQGNVQTRDPFKQNPDYGDAEPSVHRARDARDKGLKNLEKIQADKIPVQRIINRPDPDGDTHFLMFPKASNKPLTTDEVVDRVESGKMRPSRFYPHIKAKPGETPVEGKRRPRDEYGFTDLKKPGSK